MSMAGLSFRFGPRRRLWYHGYRLPRLAFRSEYTAAAATKEFEPDGDGETGKVPLVPKKKDPDAVLKALSSTVKPLKHPLQMGGRSIADPLAPHTRLEQMEYLRAKEAGRRAAQYFIHRWPRMFPDKKPEPDLRPKKEKVEGCNEKALKYLISARKTGKAVKMFRTLQEKGDSVSLETQNQLLGLLAHYGLGNPWRTGSPVRFVRWKAAPSENTGVQGGQGPSEKVVEELGSEVMEEESIDSDSDSSEDESSSDEEEGEEENMSGSHSKASSVSPTRSKVVKGMSRVWSQDNMAEKFFAEMTEKDGGTYGALITGLVKFKDYDRAFDMFVKMREDGHQASITTYNSLLSIFANTSETQQVWRQAKDVAKQMTEEPAVKPNITTFNLLLSVTHQAAQSEQLALKVMKELAILGIEPNLTTFGRLLKAHTLHEKGSILFEIVDYLEQNPQVITLQERDDMQFLTDAMHTARLLWDPTLAKRLKTMAMKDNWFLVLYLKNFLNDYMYILAKSADLSLLKQEYRSLVPDVFYPEEWAYGSLFRTCEDQMAPEFALELWNDLLKRNRVIKLETMERVCGALSNKVDPNDVDRYIEALLTVSKKVEEQKMIHPPFLISQLIRLHTLVDELDKAWEYYGYFEKNNIRPTFLALASLLKAHYGYRDSKKIVEIMETMIDLGMYLPATFVKDMCWKCEVAVEVRERMIAEFSKNSQRGAAHRTTVMAKDSDATTPPGRSEMEHEPGYELT